MKRGFITKTNKKGQIVIPKKLREALNIKNEALVNLVKRGKGIYIYPVSDIISEADTEKSYPKILKETRGTWTKNWSKTRKQRRETELKASKKRKKSW